jgi:hypothetical protein
MIKSTYKSGLTCAALAAAGLLASTTAHAALQFSGNFDGTVFSCVDGAACDSNSNVGFLNPGTTTQNNTNEIIEPNVLKLSPAETSSATTLNSGPIPTLTSSSGAIYNLSQNPITIQVTVSDINFIGPATTYSLSGSGTFTNASGATITDVWYNSSANTQGANNPTDRPGELLSMQSFTSDQPIDSFSFNLQGNLNPIDGSAFGLTVGFDLTIPGYTDARCLTDLNFCPQLTGRSQNLQVTSPIPEPTGLALLGGGLAMLGGVIRKRFLRT